MPPYLNNLYWLKFIWPLAVMMALVTLIIWVGYRSAAHKSGKPESMLIIFGFCSLGLTVGVLAGDSGEQVISTVLPAVLSLVGGLAVYLIGREAKDAYIVAASIAALSFTLLLGAVIGANNRIAEKDQYQAQINIQEKAQKTLDKFNLDRLEMEIQKENPDKKSGK